MSETLTQKEIRAFILPAHGDLEQVKKMLVEDPRLLDACYKAWDETALGAASHVGNREIAEYLLAQGAKLTICAAAMLGDRHQVELFLVSNPNLANGVGAHGISLLYHAAQSGNTAVTDLLAAYGNTQDAEFALQGAVAHGRADMVRWLLARGANGSGTNWQGKTALQVATERGDQEIVKLLSKSG